MDADDTRAQLDRILQSAPFARAERLCRFLRLVVEAAQCDTRQSLKEYRIGVEVFDRGKDFDPRIDPIVRVQAAKLRSKLLEYYAGAGAADPLVITIPKGSYSAEIRARRTPAAAVTAQPALERSRIAVLPFVNMSADPENEHFSDGLTEELINRLASVPTLRVVARTSAFRFKGQNEDIRDVGAKLNVGTVMEGSVRKAGDQLRVTAQLIDVGSGYHLFSRTYQREYKNIFDLQDELAQAVVDEIVPKQNGAGYLIAKTRTTTLDAYNVYLRAMFALSNRFADLPECVKLFREALSMEPDYAPAWAGLAHAYWMHAWFYLMPTQQALPLLKEAALRTLELDDQLAQGHSSLGLFESGFEWNWTAGEARFRRAIELQPGLAIIYPFYAVAALLPQLRLQEACSMVERGLSLDPFNPLFHAIAVFVYANAGRHEDALRQYALGLEVNPLFPPTLGAGAIAYERAGRLAEAIPMFQRLCELTQDRPAPLSFLGHALAISGQRAEAQRILQRLLALPMPPDLDIARVYIGLRDAENALRHLEAATLHRDVHLLTVPSDRRFDWLRPHPAFQQILRRMSLGAAAPDLQT
jgi:TolB-like protein